MLLSSKMLRGKQTCKILKEIRKQIADANDIEYVVSECKFKGDCLGTCPKCEAEVRYLEEQLNHRRMLGKAVVLAGISLSALTANANTDVISNDCQCTDSILATDSVSDGVLPGVIESMPSFPGGHQAMMKYFAENIHWPNDFCGQGEVMVGCVVNENGCLSDVEIERGVCPELDKEAIRVVKSMPKWIPGFYLEKRAKFRIQIPVVFRLE